MYFKNELTGETTTIHPANEYFQKLVSRHRYGAGDKDAYAPTDAQGATADSASPWMRFVGNDGRPYFYNFATGEQKDYGPSQTPEKVHVETCDDTSATKLPTPQGSVAFERQSEQATQRLCFKSWWTEGGSIEGPRQRLLNLAFNVLSGEFEVELDKDPNMYTLSHIEGRLGPLECWDLHIGAKVDVLGYKLTLRQADVPTVTWLEMQADRLTRHRTLLNTQLRKYAPARSAAYEGRFHRGSARSEKDGSRSLRKLIQECDEIAAELGGFRPDVVTKLNSQLAL